MKLYEISAELRDTLAELDAADGVLEGDLEMRLDMVEMAFADKVEACLAVAAERRAEADAIVSEAKRLTERARRIESEAKRIHDYVATSMVTTGQRKVTGRLFTAYMQRNPARLVLTGDVPDEWTETITTVKPRNADIKAALSSGETLAFACLEQGESLRVK